MSKTTQNLYQSYETFRQGLQWKEGTTDETIAAGLSVLQQFIKFLVENEWKSGVSTKRDQFAMSALSGIIANEGVLDSPKDPAELEGFNAAAEKDAQRAYLYADAMGAASEA